MVGSSSVIYLCFSTWVQFFSCSGLELLVVRSNGMRGLDLGDTGRLELHGTATTIRGSSFFHAPLLGFPIGVLVSSSFGEFVSHFHMDVVFL